LQNIHNATILNINQLLNKIRNFKYQTTLPLTLKNFSNLYHIPLQLIYKSYPWKRLCVKSNQIEDYPPINENEIYRAISKKWLSCNSNSYFRFILSLAKNNFQFDYNAMNDDEKSMCLMLHYDIWQNEGGFNSLEESLKSIGKNEIMVQEIIEVLEILIDRIDFLEIEINLPYSQPLKIHSRYTREQILSAFGFNTFNKKSKIKEGVAFSKEKNTELLFITLDKSTKDFSPTTLYEDFALSDKIFHWQTQNLVSPDKGKGLTYINHLKEEKKILLFVREKSEDEYGNTMASVFLGEGKLIEYNGSKPMSIKWELNEPMPPFLWKYSAKMAVG